MANYLLILLCVFVYVFFLSFFFGGGGVIYFNITYKDKEKLQSVLKHLHLF